VRRLIAVSMLLAVIDGGLVGCGSASSSSTGSPSPASVTTTAPTSASTSISTSTSASATSSARRRRRPARGRTAPRHAPPIGRAQTVRAGDSILSVTVTKVYDPLTDSGAALLPGTRAAGVALTIRVERGATYDSTASGDVSVVASSGMPAPLFIRQGVCETPLTDFESLIGVGETHSGCVGFAIPHGARIVAVRFSPHSRARGTVTWR
jgi:hypothetical protein